MAKAVALVLAICLLALAALTHGHGNHKNVFSVKGEVYCDTCRVQFHHELSQKLVGATVRLECSNIDTKVVTYSVEGVTDANGWYNVQVVGEHENEICEVNVVKSPRSDCNEAMTEVTKPTIECTNNVGMGNAVRQANPIGFMAKTSIPECKKVIAQLAYNDDN